MIWGDKAAEDLDKTLAVKTPAARPRAKGAPATAPAAVQYVDKG